MCSDILNRLSDAETSQQILNWLVAMVHAYLSIDEVLVPPDGEGHHGVAVGHDDHWDDVLAG